MVTFRQIIDWRGLPIVATVLALLGGFVMVVTWILPTFAKVFGYTAAKLVILLYLGACIQVLGLHFNPPKGG